jgi:DNA-binding MarR family transcriptional regulator
VAASARACRGHARSGQLCHRNRRVGREEARGHVAREKNPDDGRSYLIRLTPAGRKAHRAAGIRFLPALDAVVASLGSREATVKRILENLKRAVDLAREGNA